MQTRGMGFVVGVAVAMLCAWGAPQARAVADAPGTARQIVEDPDVTYSTRVVWDCSRQTWEKALDHPLVMGALWQAYGFAPAYVVSGQPDSLHMYDPTGLLGDAFPYERDSNSMRYLVLGKLNHWAVPVMNKGLAVFAVTWQETGGGVATDVNVYVKAGSGFAGVLLRLARPLLARHVENRVSLNVQDARKIVADIEADPAAVAGRLQGAMRQEFSATFGGR
jgi:hypothetical protein